jgi:3-oxoadipate enol-lactonase
MAEVNGATLTYDDTAGDGPVVVLSHGFLLDRTMSDDPVGVLRSTYRIITWDKREFTDTDDDEQPFIIWDSAHDCLGLKDHPGVERAVFGGLSQGGLIALQVAPLAPDRVRGLVRFDTRAGLEDVEVILCYHRMIDAGVTDGPTDELAELFWKACPPSGLPALQINRRPWWAPSPGAVRIPG